MPRYFARRTKLTDTGEIMARSDASHLERKQGKSKRKRDKAARRVTRITHGTGLVEELGRLHKAVNRPSGDTRVIRDQDNGPTEEYRQALAAARARGLED